MTDGADTKEPGTGRKPLTLSRTASAGTVRQSFSHGRTNSVKVEVREKRTIGRPTGGAGAGAAPGPGVPPPIAKAPARAAPPAVAQKPAPQPRPAQGGITDDEVRRRDEAVKRALADRSEREAKARAEEEERRALEDAQRKALEEQRAAEVAAERRRIAEAQAAAAAERKARAPDSEPEPAPVEEAAPVEAEQSNLLAELGGRIKPNRRAPAPVTPTKRNEPQRRTGKLTLDMVERISEGEDERVRSLAAYRRAQMKEKERRAKMQSGERERVVREVIVPESITVQELANRMAMRVTEIIKFMMRQGQMLKMTDVIDADTAELIASEFGHTVKRVAESDVEEGLSGDVDPEDELKPRPPVVTIMGHVDHGKTSLLDALRQTDVVSGEAGGITQHIGAYQVRLKDGQRITFLDTPGHAAFSAMRSRGAHVTDIVVLVVAADDGVMPQTIEAISHARAAGVPIIVAVNKIDKADAKPERVLQELLQHEIITENFGGDTLHVEVSATQKLGLDKLVDTILLQAELLDLRANPNRAAEGVVIEARLDKGRGVVATVLIKRGTLKRGDIVVAGSTWGRVRALMDERGQTLATAGPSQPVEIMGLIDAPTPGDALYSVESETRAREVAEYRERAKREKSSVKGGAAKTSLEQMMARFKDSSAKELPILIKADVQGSSEAISGSLEKLGTDEVRARLVHAGVGGISESDVQLAKSSGAPIIGFNVRASKEARDLAEREGVEIRYYAIIYDLIDDIKGVMSGMLAPITRESFLGNAEVLEVFNISKVGKVAGCRVTEGVVRKGAKVRILRDDVVIQEMGVLTTLKRFKDEVNEVTAGQECGMSFGPFQDIKQGDVIECFNVDIVQRTL